MRLKFSVRNYSALATRLGGALSGNRRQREEMRFSFSYWLNTLKTTVGVTSKHAAAQRDSLSAALMILARWDLPGKAQLRMQATDEAARLMPRMKEAPNLWEEEWKVLASPALLPYLRKTEGSQQMRWLYMLPHKKQDNQ